MEVTDAIALGRAIRRHRKLLVLTQRDAAGLCGVGERFLSELERGKESASLGKVVQVIKRLGLRLLLDGQIQIANGDNEYA